jgi:murein DD-endopeptidase MepM/ murein hydrolase activator NlpD
MADRTRLMSLSDIGKVAGAAAKAAKAAKGAGDVAKTAKAAGDVAKTAGTAASAAKAAGDAAHTAKAAGGAANAASKFPGAPKVPGTPGVPKLGSPAKPSVSAGGASGVPGTPSTSGGVSSVGLPKGLDAPLGGPSKPVAKTSFKSDLKNAAVGGGAPANGEKQSLRAASMEVLGAGVKGVAAGAVAGAVAGGGVGALPGLIVGGVKDAGLALVTNKRFRGIAISVAAFLIVVPLVFALITYVILSSSMTAINQTNNAASVSAASVEIENEAIGDALDAQEQYGVPWTIIAAMQAKGLSTPEAFTNVGLQLSKVDPNAEYREMDAGGTYSVTSPGRIVSEDDTVATASSAKVKETYVAAMVAGAPTDQPTAEKIYDQALRWALGQEQSCKLPEDGASDVLMNVKGVPATNAQIDVATTIIGITKTVTAAMSAEDQVRAAEITMATGIVESVLTNNDKKVDHTSLGVFQQQDWWGTDEQRLRVDWATARFLKPLLMLAGWNTMEPGVAAQKIQVSAFPAEYTKRMGEAKIIVSNLWNDSPALPLPADSDMGAVTPPAGAPVNTACLAPVAAGTFVLPFVGYTPLMTSWFGKRVSPGGIGSTNHGGVDFGAPIGTPVVSIGDGAVNGVGTNRYAGCGYWITIDMPDGEARYCHFNSQSPMHVGDVVTAGQPIGVVGTTGDSTGPHLHLNINVGGVPTDPYYFLYDRGIDLELLPYWSKIGPH